MSTQIETRETGIIYKVTGDSDRGTISNYHRKPSPLMLNKTKHAVDVAGLKQITKRGNLLISGQEIESKFTIGFEVEKNQLHRTAVKEYELFCGFETDSSCGYEAVTHILPLLPPSKWRNKVFDMMHKANKIIDDQYSPSNSKCGGHITIGVQGMRGDEIREHVRNYSGIILALFRKRLNNVYCGSNRRMEADGQNRYNSFSDNNGNYYYNGWNGKYQTALVKGDVLEFRVPSRFESVKQMIRRYELMHFLVDYSINKKGSFSDFLKGVKPIIVSMYNGDEQKSGEVLKLAVLFQKFINTGEIADEIREFLR